MTVSALALDHHHMANSTFPDEEAHIIARLLEFLYTSKYSTDTDPDVAGFQRNPAVSETGRKRY